MAISPVGNKPVVGPEDAQTQPKDDAKSKAAKLAGTASSLLGAAAGVAAVVPGGQGIAAGCAVGAGATKCAEGALEKDTTKAIVGGAGAMAAAGKKSAAEETLKAQGAVVKDPKAPAKKPA